jgi:hypothetical protein
VQLVEAVVARAGMQGLDHTKHFAGRAAYAPLHGPKMASPGRTGKGQVASVCRLFRIQKRLDAQNARIHGKIKNRAEQGMFPNELALAN